MSNDHDNGGLFRMESAHVAAGTHVMIEGSTQHMTGTLLEPLENIESTFLVLGDDVGEVFSIRGSKCSVYVEMSFETGKLWFNISQAFRHGLCRPFVCVSDSVPKSELHV